MFRKLVIVRPLVRGQSVRRFSETFHSLDILKNDFKIEQFKFPMIDFEFNRSISF